MDIVFRKSLPAEVVEKILLDVPTYFLAYNTPFVCKLWTSILLQPQFWIRKLRKNNVTIKEDIKALLTNFENNIQVACLYHTCLDQENILLNTPIENSEQFSFIKSDKLWEISDNLKQIIAAAGILVTRPIESRPNEISSKDCMIVELRFDKEIITGLSLLVSLLAVRGICTKIIDKYSFWNFTPRNEYEKIYEKEENNAHVLSFMGCLKTFKTAMYSYICLSFAVDENNKVINPVTQYNSIRPYEDKHLFRAIHLKAGSDVSGLTNCISAWFQLSLVISGLEPNHVPWLIDIIYESHLHVILLALPSYKLNYNESESFLRKMSRKHISPVYFMCTSSTLNSDDAKKLNDMCKKKYFGHQSTSFTWFESDEMLKIGVQECDSECGQDSFN